MLNRREEIAQMPSYVIMQSAGRIGETVQATLCNPSVTGFPDRRSDVPVQARLVSEQMLCVDDEPRRIIWSTGENGVTTFLVDGSTRGVRNRERRAALARASGFFCSNSLRPSCRLRPKAQNQDS
jgi:hypothetical protein